MISEILNIELYIANLSIYFYVLPPLSLYSYFLIFSLAIRKYAGLPLYCSLTSFKMKNCQGAGSKRIGAERPVQTLSSRQLSQLSDCLIILCLRVSVPSHYPVIIKVTFKYLCCT